MKNLSRILFATFCVLSIWACDQKSTSKSPVQTVRQYRDGQGNSYNNYNGVVGSGPNGNAQPGRIYAQYDSQFNNALKALVSASFDPANLGYVNPQNGVVLRGYLEINQNMIIPERSNLSITITDNFAISGQARPEDISFPTAAPLQPGQQPYIINSNGQFSIVFADSFGSITLNGMINGDTISGQVYFRNLKSFDSVSQPREGTLGDFQIPRCSFIRCN